MNENWNLVKLSEIVRPVLRPVAVEAGVSFRTIGVKWWGEGAYERETIDGSQTAAKTLFIVHQGDLIINKIWVRHGSIAIATKAVDGCAASGEFPTFELDQSKVLPRWLHWLSKTKLFWEKCDKLSQGTSGKNRIKPELFLTISIPLPLVEEQQRIVAQIDELAAKIEEARGLRQASSHQLEILSQKQEFEYWSNIASSVLPLSEVTTYLARGRQSKQGESNHYLIKTQHVQMKKYVESKLTLSPEVSSSVSSDALAQKGDVLIACSAAGCLGRVAFYDVDSVTASTDTHVAIARANQDAVLPEYLFAYLSGAMGQYQLRSRERGDWTKEKISYRLAELNMRDLREVPVPTIPFEEQKRIVAQLDELQAKTEAVKRLQAETTAELDALMPAVLDRAFKGEL